MPFEFPAETAPRRGGAAAVLVDFPLMLVAGCVVACAAVVVALGAYWVTRPVPDPLAVEGAAAPGTGASGQQALRLPWGAFGSDAGAQSGDSVFITVLPADASLAPAERPSVLYARFVAAEARSAPGGLIRRRFRDGTPFEGEDLVVAASDGRAFWARCATSGSRNDGASCLTEMRFGNTDVQVRFSPALLPRWELLASGLHRRYAPAPPALTR